MDELSRLTTALAARYQIEREIGAGGMATVFLARDLKHDRKVALKMLKPELGAILGVERFLSEIRVTANLQHPNLLPLFDSGEEDGLLFYVMPYVEGESLRDRLMRERHLTVDEAVRLATAIAGALDYAHRHGVIHRDLKPENILLHEGQPLVADFGIALAVSNAGGARITQTGLSLGTPQYMSPEQATGDRVIDGRTDIYSLGAVLYEMLAGEPPHTAATAQGVIAKLMVEVPRSMMVLRPSVPAHVDAAVRHALEKLPADRFATGREFAEALGATHDADMGPARATSSPWRLAAIGSLAAAAIFAAVAIGARAKLARLGDPQSVHFKLDLPQGEQFVTMQGTPVAISHDGRTIAYSATGPRSSLLYVRRLDGLQTNGFAAGELQADMYFSPDDQWIAFASSATGSRIDRIAAAGGVVTNVVRPISVKGLAWTPDGKIVYADSGALWRVDAPGTTPRKIFGVAAGKGEEVSGPFVTPDGKDVVFLYLSAKGAQWAMVSMDGGDMTPLTGLSGNPLGYADGWLIYGREGGGISARKFDQGARRFSGEAVGLLDGVAWQDAGGLEAALSRTGTLVYISGDAGSSLLLLDGRGVAGPPTSVSGAYSSPVWSPDGKRIALDKLSPAGDHTIWVYDVASKALSLISGPATDGSRPAWTADGKRVAFVVSGLRDSAIVSVPWDLSGPEEVFYAEAGLQFREVGFSADGKYAVLRTDNSGRGKGDIYMLPLSPGSQRKAVALVKSPASEEMPAVSPDGHWLAYQSDQTGRFEIYVRPFPGAGGRVQVSADGGLEPRWTPDGTHIVYRGPHAFWSATLSTTTGAQQVIGRDSLFSDPFRRSDPSHQGYDVGRDGRIAVFRPAGNLDIVVITNWWNEARAKLPR